MVGGPDRDEAEGLKDEDTEEIEVETMGCVKSCPAVRALSWGIDKRR